MRPLLAIVVAAVGCSTPPLKLDLAITTTMSDSCGAQSCTEIHIPCASVLSIRIVDPNLPSAPFISQCVPVLQDTHADLCSIAQVDLDQKPLPEQTLEVQVVVYPAEMIPIDPDNGELICPTERDGLSFDASNGFPRGEITLETSDPAKPSTFMPAIGGRAFYHPGDTDTVVTLGCNDLGSLQTCTGGPSTMVTATVLDFDNQQSLAVSIADLVSVAVGEPRSFTDPMGIDRYQLTSSQVRALPRTDPDMPPALPSWGGSVDLQFTESACLQVLEDGPATTATLTCKQTTHGTPVDITGIRLAKPSLQTIVTALGSPSLDHGLVVGIVLDEIGTAAGNQKVSVPPTVPPVEYLSADRMSVGGTTTSTNGIFISRNAPFGTTFSAGSGPTLTSAYGGLVDGKITIVVLQFGKSPISQ